MPLTAAELIEHPAYSHLAWKLPPTSSGTCDVAHNRTGGPFPIYYQLHGHGPTRLFFIMGLGAYHTAWKRQTRYFGHQHADQYTVCVFDNRGMGRSGKPKCRYSTSEMAKDCIDLLLHINWLEQPSLNTKDYRLPQTSTGHPHKFTPIGVSMGGMIAQELALLLPPQTLESLILVSTAPRLIRTTPFLANLRQRINMFIPRDLDVQLEEISHRLFSDEFLEEVDTEADEEFTGGPGGGNFPTNRDRYCAGEVEKRLDKVGYTRWGFMAQAVAAGWHHKSEEGLKEIVRRVGEGRVAVCHGTQDRMIDFVHGEMLRDELGLVKVGKEEGVEEGRAWRVWKGRGHVLCWEEEKEFNAWLEAVVRRCEGMDS